MNSPIPSTGLTSKIWSTPSTSSEPTPRSSLTTSMNRCPWGRSQTDTPQRSFSPTSWRNLCIQAWMEVPGLALTRLTSWRRTGLTTNASILACSDTRMSTVSWRWLLMSLTIKICMLSSGTMSFRTRRQSLWTSSMDARSTLTLWLLTAMITSSWERWLPSRTISGLVLFPLTIPGQVPRRQSLTGS